MGKSPAKQALDDMADLRAAMDKWLKPIVDRQFEILREKGYFQDLATFGHAVIHVDPKEELLAAFKRVGNTPHGKAIDDYIIKQLTNQQKEGKNGDTDNK